MEAFNYKAVMTHNTIFHADDVFGVAMCMLINPGIQCFRTTDQMELEKAKEDPSILMFDIGMGKYDHHQEDKALRTDGTPYCGFGLLWRDFGHLLCPEEEAWKVVDETFVLPIDKADNGIAQNLLSQSIKAMNPCWNSYETEDEAFANALNIAMPILKATVNRANAAVEAKEKVLEYYMMGCTYGSPMVAKYSGENILVMDQYLPYSDVVAKDSRLKDVCFVVYPSKRGGWNVQTVSKEPGQFVNRMDFPSEWLGHADPDRGIRFAHTANFLIACDTKEQAVKVAEEALEAGKDGVKVVCSI